jgi:hypothetical protein
VNYNNSKWANLSGSNSSAVSSRSQSITPTVDSEFANYRIEWNSEVENHFKQKGKKKEPEMRKLVHLDEDREENPELDKFLKKK